MYWTWENTHKVCFSRKCPSSGVGRCEEHGVQDWRQARALAVRRTLALPSESRLLSLWADLLLFCVIGFDENIESQGELILQESFQVWDPKTLIRKGRERHLFLFEMSLVFSKEVKDSSGRSKYLYKSKLFVSIGIQHPSLPAVWLRPSCGEREFLFVSFCYLPNYSKMGIWIVKFLSSVVMFSATHVH